MKKLTMVLMCCMVLVGCANKSQSTYESTAQVTNEAKEPQEYSYAELKKVCDSYTDEYLEELSKLSDVELFGLSDDEESSNKKYWKVANSIADKVLEDCEIPQGQRIIVTGYIGKQGESKEDGFFVRQGLNKFFFHLKHEATDNGYDGLLCRTDETVFLELEENTPVKIEATFMKKGFVASDNDLYDCEILEEGEPVNVEINAPYPTAAIAQ